MTIKFSISPPVSANNYSFAFSPAKCEIKKVSKRIKYDFINGDRDSVLLKEKLKITIEYDQLTLDEYDGLMSFIEAFKNSNIYFVCTEGAARNINRFNQSCLLDIEDDEINLLKFDFIDKRPLKITFYEK